MFLGGLEPRGKSTSELGSPPPRHRRDVARVDNIGDGCGARGLTSTAFEPQDGPAPRRRRRRRPVVLAGGASPRTLAAGAASGRRRRSTGAFDGRRGAYFFRNALCPRRRLRRMTASRRPWVSPRETRRAAASTASRWHAAALTPSTSSSFGNGNLAPSHHLEQVLQIVVLQQRKQSSPTSLSTKRCLCAFEQKGSAFSNGSFLTIRGPAVVRVPGWARPVGVEFFE